MKLIVGISIMALFMVSLAPTPLVSALDSGPSANGNFQFVVGDGVTRYIDFNAKTDKDGMTKGEMTFTDPSGVAPTDPDNPGDPSSSSPRVLIKVEFDCLVVKGTRAVMSGVIVSSNFPNSMGQRVLLTVEDNGEGLTAPASDRLAWGIYGNPIGGWTPSDAEREDDQGWFSTWLAKDAERGDDVGVPNSRSTVIGCQSFSLSSYSFVNVDHGYGNIQVKP